MRKTRLQRLIVYFSIISGAFFLCYPPLECGAASYDNEPYFYDRLGELLLMGKGNDIYVEKLNSDESRKVTNTPDLREFDAFFSQGGSIIVYKAERKKSAFDKTSSYECDLFIQPTDKNDLEKKEIDYFLYKDLKRERIKQRDYAE